MRYEYDNAHRFTVVTESSGNKLIYSYQLASNGFLDQVTDSANGLLGKIARGYDALNFLKQRTGGTQ